MTPLSVIGALAGRKPNRAGYARANCPLCALAKGSEDRDLSLWGSAEIGRWGCFRCGAGGRLEAEDGFEPRGKPEERPQVELPEGYYQLGLEPGLSAVSLAPAREYVRRRGVSERMLREAEVGACASGPAAGRVVVPIRRVDGSLAGWVGRAWGPAWKKYLYAQGTERVLYNARCLDADREGPVIAVEGTFDTFPYWPDAVAFLGSPTEAQAQVLERSKRPVAVVLDGDAWRQGEALAMRLRRAGVRATSVRLGPREDPDERPEEVRRLAQEGLV